MRVLALVAAAIVLCCLSAAAMAAEVAPLAVSNRALGGGALNQYTPGVAGGVGLNNIGLLVKTSGKVTAVDTANSCFYIDDGTGLLDGSGHVGVRVAYDNLAAGNSITPPAVDSYVLVTGICSTIVINSNIQPNLRPRRDADIQQISP